jgi:hypothetical protein
MARREKTVRGALIIKWEQAGKPNWDRKETIRLCEAVDKDFSKQGLTPAPRFREERQRNNVPYMATWVMGCHFPWLNP